MRSIIQTDSDSYVLLFARLALGIVILPHGLQKLIGLFGGYGFSATVGFFESMGIPSIVAILVIVAESAGAASLIIGFMSRFCAFALAMVMAGAVYMVHLQHGFFMNWSGNQQGEGFEYHILAIGLALVVLIGGGGKFSIDGSISNS